MKNKPDDSVKGGFNKFVRFSTIAFEMAIIIAAGTWGGVELDKHFETEKPIFTIILSLLAVFAALYLVIKQVLNANK
jgi:ATP synthase protein I